MEGTCDGWRGEAAAEAAAAADEADATTLGAKLVCMTRITASSNLLSKVTCRTSHVAYHASNVTRYISHVTRDTAHIARKRTRVTKIVNHMMG